MAKKRDWVWVSRDIYLSGPSMVVDIWPEKEKPAAFECGARVDFSQGAADCATVCNSFFYQIHRHQNQTWRLPQGPIQS